MQRTPKAFTLVEILIVISVIALLATILIPNVMRVRLIANEAIAQTTLKTISTALESYANDNDQYPVDPILLLSTIPSYLNTDYFTGMHTGYTYTPLITNYSYQVTATPSSTNAGTRTFLLTTGGVIQEAPPAPST